MHAIERDEWGALRQATLVPIIFRPGRHLIVHHGASAAPPVNATESTDAGYVKAYDRQHFYVNGWRGGIGYNYAVAPSGRIFVGRGQASGAHTVGHNDEPAVVLIGDYRIARPSRHMRASVWELAEFLRRDRLTGHRNYWQTTCPGDAAMRGMVLLGPIAPEPRPYDGSLRLDVAGNPHAPWAGWDECAGPLRWIVRNGLEEEPAGAGRHWIAWRGRTWYGPRDVANVARNLAGRYL